MKNAASLFAFVAAACLSVSAAADTLIFAGPGGSWEKFMYPKVLKPYEKTCNCTIKYQSGTSNENLARIVASKGNPEIDVFYSGNVQQEQAAAQGLLVKLDKKKISNLPDIFSTAAFNNDYNAALGVIGSGIAYNTEIFKEKGFPAPTSVRDLARPEYKGHVVIHPTANNYGLNLLLLAAKAEGGSEANIDPGFKLLKTMRDNAGLLAQTEADMSRAFQQKAAWIAWWGDVRANTLAASGFPVKFVTAKEGIPSIIMGASVVKDSKVADKGMALINYLLSAEVQETLARELNLGPTVKSAKLSAAEAQGVVYGPEQMGRLLQVDWDLVNNKKAEWIERWNREIQ